jgi:hypothetical protein
MTGTPSAIVRLRFYIGDGMEEPWEEDAPRWFGDHPQEKPPLYDQEGSIYVIAEGQEVRFSDQLLSVVPALCFDAVATVLAAGVAEFDLYTAATSGRLRIEGDEVEIVSNVFLPARFPKREVLEGLVACGERFVRMADALWVGDPYHDVLAGIAQSGAVARTQLNAAFTRG